MKARNDWVRPIIRLGPAGIIGICGKKLAVLGFKFISVLYQFSPNFIFFFYFYDYTCVFSVDLVRKEELNLLLEISGGVESIKDF